jgi:hypothetical protein
VQHATVWQSNKSGCPLSEEAEYANSVNRKLGARPGNI